MKVLNKTFPGCMISGLIPASCIPTPPNSSRSTARRNGQRYASKSHEMGVANFSPTSSLSKEVSEHKERFTEEGIMAVNSCRISLVCIH